MTAIIPFAQHAYVGTRAIVFMGATPLQVRGDTLSLSCSQYAETHVAEAEAQFNDYVVRAILPAGVPAPATPATIFPPAAPFRRRNGKRSNPGISGHLGEGAGPLAISQLVPNATLFRLGVTAGNQIRCPDYGLRVSFQDFYNAYGIAMPNPPCALPHQTLNIPVEAKSYQHRASTMNVRSAIINNGAFEQMACYWWAMRASVPEVAGFGVVTMFCYRSRDLVHVVLVPKDATSQQTLLNLLASCGDKDALYKALRDQLFRNQVLDCLGGF